MVSRARASAVPDDVKDAKKHAAYAAVVDNAQWLSHPLTRKLIATLNEQREGYLKSATVNSMGSDSQATERMRNHLFRVTILEEVIETINSNK